MSTEQEITINSDGLTLKGEVVNDVRPPIQRVSKTADSILRLIDNVVGLPADFISSYLEPFREQYREGYKKIPKKRRIEPSLRIGCSVLKNVAYAAEEPDIQRLFARLLTSASDADYADIVHPGYASVVNELTTIDAKVLMLFSSGYRQRSLSDNEQPYESQLISNLIRLGLIGWVERDYTPSELNKFIGRKNYSAPRRLEETNKVVIDLINDVQNLKNRIVQDSAYARDRQVLRLTDFGKNFIGVAFGNSG
ncbi:DUF4393 domain-containing protein [Vibrio parahaemolyticus]|uniref:DUF4393 domain-containing protein n=1 Tax=Vibrio parahaemolyticus TaxID=670 RepID=A0A9Q3UJZ6_VIBPH|nr:Abi-alpha family protein [Vibrio parahaemolyticus]EGQ7800173.1 DUF4393 domain-containing protein [Vibrio parahaemolyticus]EGQ8200718.1 DUF4393 domain-containing protein [Vibrio parahaemolyticus]EGQ8551764.1 DUF4393 domain-containing protein [Vibrio parahaemolyticus]EGQ9075179.1 DUF4393 domain-containing protein [Vibrio parahaemolyticus]EGQ9133269.1 DUF4393 domain-containing protein [Vibrio parahaemolyticus]